jgi:hypothetical protein
MLLSEDDVIEIADRRWRFTHVAPGEAAPGPRDNPTGAQWRTRAPQTGRIDVVTDESPRRRRRAMAGVLGAIILLAAIAGLLLAVRG